MTTKKEYIIVENTTHNGWCLHCLAGYIEENAIKRLQERQQQYPNKELKIETVEPKEAWWNQGYLD